MQNLVTMAPLLLACLTLPWTVDESPRWLLVHRWVMYPLDRPAHTPLVAASRGPPPCRPIRLQCLSYF